MKVLSQTAKGRGILSVWALAAAFNPPTHGCPICDSETGVQVRQRILSADFGANLLATVLPFIVVLGFAAVIHHGGIARTSKRNNDSNR